jgi:hypothetical protein
VAEDAGRAAADTAALRIVVRQLSDAELRRETALMERRYREAQGTWTILKREMKRRKRGDAQ